MDPQPSLAEEAENKKAHIEDKITEIRTKLHDQASATNKAVEKAIASLKNASNEATEEEKKARQVSEDFNNAIKKAIETLDFVQNAANDPPLACRVGIDEPQEFSESNPATPPPDDDVLSPLNLAGDESPLLLTQETPFEEEECIKPKNIGKGNRASERKKSGDTKNLSDISLGPVKTIEK